MQDWEDLQGVTIGGLTRVEGHTRIGDPIMVGQLGAVSSQRVVATAGGLRVRQLGMNH